MVCIYMMHWDDKVYIGQTCDLRLRKNMHLHSLRNGTHSNYKCQEMYNTLGEPEFTVLEECKTHELAQKEIEWTEEFDSLNTGLNIVAPGISSSGNGFNANAAVYSKRQILKVFALLYKTELTHREIAARAKVSVQCVNGITNYRRAHKWLAEEYPEKYTMMLERNLRKLKKPKKLKELEIKKFWNPAGKYVEITNMAQYCREELGCENPRVFAQGLSGVHSGRIAIYKGWRKYSS